MFVFLGLKIDFILFFTKEFPIDLEYLGACVPKPK